MNKKLLATLSVLCLFGCTYNTTSGGSDSLIERKTETNQVDYQLPQAIKNKIDKQEKVIVLTELVTIGAFRSLASEVNDIHSFTEDVTKKMLDQGYILMSSDTNSMGQHGDQISVTLIFHKLP